MSLSRFYRQVERMVGTEVLHTRTARDIVRKAGVRFAEEDSEEPGTTSSEAVVLTTSPDQSTTRITTALGMDIRYPNLIHDSGLGYTTPTGTDSYIIPTHGYYRVSASVGIWYDSYPQPSATFLQTEGFGLQWRRVDGGFVDQISFESRPLPSSSIRTPSQPSILSGTTYERFEAGWRLRVRFTNLSGVTGREHRPDSRYNHLLVERVVLLPEEE
jgi:hypothetical protein